MTGVWPCAQWTGRLFTEDYLPEAAKNAGLPLCGGYKFAVWQLSADLDYLSNYLELRHFNSLTPCFLCGCNPSTVPWTALTPEATWRSRLATMAEWSNTERHSLFSTPSVGVNVFHVLLHVLDFGICQHICASSLYPMVFDSALPGTLEEKLGRMGAGVHRPRCFGHGRW